MNSLTTKAALLLLAAILLSGLKLSAQDPDFYIYLCFGQSNMEGQGTIEPQDTTVNSRFKVFQAMD
ncbi:MAG TPA: sialate O-acetylesterase, partial [Bacteroidales bacterium]|nr:sialate O-acetylesterase [Bacteroidales bacterium]